MKMNKFFMLGLASLAFAACSNEDAVNDPSSGKTASMIIKLNGVVSTRSVGDPTTAQNDDVIGLQNGTILFTNGTTILKVANLELDEATGEGQLIHEVPAAVSQVQIVGNMNNKESLKEKLVKDGTLAAVKAAVIKAGTEQDMTILPLFGEDTSLEVASGVTDPNEDHTSIFQAEVNLTTLFSRIEIGDFKCTNLGNSYSKVDIKVVGLLNFKNGITLGNTASDPVDIYYKDPETGAESGIVLEPGTTSVPEGKVVFGETHADYGWAWDKFTNPISMTDANTAYNPQEGKKCVYDFIPNGNVLAALYVDATPKTSAALRINTTLKGKLGALNPGYIYRVNYTFDEEDIHPWNPDETKCVNVDVTVQKWTIATLTPTFE